MKETGIIRRIDELGRIVIPRDIRNVLGIKPNDELEIVLDSEIIGFKKCSSNTEEEQNKKRIEALNDFIGDVVTSRYENDITTVIMNDGSVGRSKWNNKDKFNSNLGLYWAMYDAGWFANIEDNI